MIKKPNIFIRAWYWLVGPQICWKHREGKEMAYFTGSWFCRSCLNEKQDKKERKIIARDTRDERIKEKYKIKSNFWS